MRTSYKPFAVILLFIFIVALPHYVGAAVKYFRGGTTSQLSQNGGVWDFGTSAKWVSESDTGTLVTWNNNNDIAVIQNQPGGSHVTINIDDSHGFIGASGIIITNNLAGDRHDICQATSHTPATPTSTAGRWRLRARTWQCPHPATNRVARGWNFPTARRSFAM